MAVHDHTFASFCTESVLVGFYPSEYIVTEGEAAMLRIVLSMSFSEEVTVELQTGDGSATGIHAYRIQHLDEKCTTVLISNNRSITHGKSVKISQPCHK